MKIFQNLTFILIISFLLTACGSVDEGSVEHDDATAVISALPTSDETVDAIEKPIAKMAEYEYVTEFAPVDLGEISVTLMTEDKFYYLSNEFNEAEDIYESNDEKIFIYDLNTAQSSEIPYTLPENITTLGPMYQDVENNLFMLTYFWEQEEERFFGYRPDSSRLIKLNSNYEEIFNIDLLVMSSHSYNQIESSCLDSKGNFYYIDHWNNAVKLDSNGEFAGKIEIPDEYFAPAIITAGNDTVYIMDERYDENYVPDVLFIRTDFASGELTEESCVNIVNSMGETFMENTRSYFTFITKAPNEDAFFAGIDDELVKIYPSTGKLESQLLWINADIEEYRVSSFFACVNDNFKVLLRKATNTSHYSGYTIDTVAALTKTRAEKLPKKTVITCGYIKEYGLFYEKEILAFNSQSNDYRIKAVSCQRGIGEESVIQLGKALSTEFVADILVWPPGLDFIQYGETGALADVGALIDLDSEMSRGDFLPGVLEAFQKNDKLYAIPKSVSLDTLLAVKDTPHIAEGWDIDAFSQYMQYNQSDEPILGFRDIEAFDRFITTNYSSIVDIEAKQCYFDTAEYRKFLELCNRFSKDGSNWGLSSDKDREKWKELIMQGRMLYEMQLPSFIYSLEYIRSRIFGGKEYVNVGYPTNDGSNGAVLKIYTPIVISARSEHIDGAWRFLRTLYMQSDVMEDVFDKNCKDYFKGMAEEEIGKDEQYPTQADILWFKSVVANSRMGRMIPVQIKEVMREEAWKYFRGKISVEEAAENTQYGVMLYLSSF